MTIIRRVNGEIAVNTVTASAQLDPAVAPLANGGFAIAWTDNSGTGTDWDSGGIKAQAFDSAGAKVGGEFEVNTQIRGGQLSQSIAGLASGNFVVTWTSNWPEPGDNASASVQARLFDSSGNALGAQFTVNTTTAGDQISPAVFKLASGGFVIAWQDQAAAGGANIMAQRFDSAGAKVGGEFTVNSTLTGFQGGATGVELASGALLFAWTDSSANDGDVRGRLFDAGGNPLGDDFLLNTLVTNTQGVPDVAALPGGGFVATWQSLEFYGTQFSGSFGYRTRAQVFAADGSKVGAEIFVSSTTQVVVSPTVTTLPSGAFFIAWSEDSTAPGIVVSAMMGQFFDPEGNRVGPAVKINTNPTSQGDWIDLATLPSGEIVATWFNAAREIAAQRLLPPEVGTSGADILAGAGGDDAILGLGGDDVLSGGAGADELVGGAGDDELHGGADNDILLAGTGEDSLFGDEGNDVLYFGATLGAGDVADGGDGRDSVVLQGNVTLVLTETNLVGIESISLQSGSNTRFGDAANNLYDFNLTMADGNVAAGVQLIVNASSLRVGEDFTFDGSAEHDGQFLVYGGFGVDTLKGGDGNDIFFFEGGRWGSTDTANGGLGRDSVVISGGNGLNFIQFGSTSLTGIESISLNNKLASDPTTKPSYVLFLHNDNVTPGGTLIVNGNSLVDPAQTVSINGSAVAGGNLNLFGGAGSDTLTGGSGTDLLYGAGGKDQLTGGAGADTFLYQSTSESTAGNADGILDFVAGTDKIDLHLIDADTNTAGDQAFHWIGATAFAGTGAASAGELRAYEAGGKWFVEGDTDGNGSADFVLEVSTFGGAALGPGDFLP